MHTFLVRIAGCIFSLSLSEYISSSLFRHGAENEIGNASSPTDGIKRKKTRCLLENVANVWSCQNFGWPEQTTDSRHVLLSEELRIQVEGSSEQKTTGRLWKWDVGFTAKQRSGAPFSLLQWYGQNARVYAAALCGLWGQREGVQSEQTPVFKCGEQALWDSAYY